MVPFQSLDLTKWMRKPNRAKLQSDVYCLLIVSYMAMSLIKINLTDKDTNVNKNYTQLQKKPISHFSGELWKIEVRNENIFIPIPYQPFLHQFIE